MEVYGEKPKMFTKAWYGYFWMYYKNYVFAVLFIAMLVVPFIWQHITAPEYDLSVMIAGKRVIADEAKEDIKNQISEVIKDIDENGEKNIDIQSMVFGDSSDPEYLLAQNTKVMADISAGETFLYIFSKEKADEFLNNGDAELMFVPVFEYAPNVPEDRLMLSKGTPYAVKITDGSLKDFCIMVRNIRQEEENGLKQENAKKAAGYLAEE